MKRLTTIATLFAVGVFPSSPFSWNFPDDIIRSRLDDIQTKVQETIQKTLDHFETQDILVKMRSPAPSSTIEEFAGKHGISFKESHFLEVKTFQYRGANFAQKLEALRADPNVEYAEPDYDAQAFAVPNDPYFSHQWNFGSSGLNLPEVWEKATGKAAVVAVIDTGVAYENYRTYRLAPDLAQTKFIAGYNFVSRTTHANDDNGHGTHVAGTIAQSTNNNLGVAGLAYNATLMPIKVLNKRGSGKYSAIADGIVWAANKGANIINLSLGGPSPSETMRQALSYAKNKGVLLVAASGNDGAGTVSYPAAYDAYVVAVGATRFDKTVTSYSNRGVALDLVAPGGDLKVDQDKNGYGDGILQQTFSGKPTNFGFYFYQGTSMAAPHVAAAAALLVEKGIRDPAQLQQILQSAADDLQTPGWDAASGYGLLNPLRALQAAGF